MHIDLQWCILWVIKKKYIQQVRISTQISSCSSVQGWSCSKCQDGTGTTRQLRLQRLPQARAWAILRETSRVYRFRETASAWIQSMFHKCMGPLSPHKFVPKRVQYPKSTCSCFVSLLFNMHKCCIKTRLTNAQVLQLHLKRFEWRTPEKLQKQSRTKEGR